MSSADEDETFYDAQAADDETHARDAQTRGALPQFTLSPAAATPPPPTPTLRSPRTSHTPGPTAAKRVNPFKAPQRSSLPASIPDVPPIPPRFLDTGRATSVTPPVRSFGDPARVARPRDSGSGPASASRVDPPRPASFTVAAKTSTTRASLPSPRGNAVAAHPREAHPAGSTLWARRKSLPPIALRVHQKTLEKLESAPDCSTPHDMTRPGKGRDDDLFLELAQDQDADETRPPSRGERVASRLSRAAKRRSLPIDTSFLTSPAEHRPSSSGNIFAARPVSRLDATATDSQRLPDRHHRASSRASFQPEDTARGPGKTVSGRATRYTVAAGRSSMSPRLLDRLRSPELPSFGTRRPSVGSAGPYTSKGRLSQLSARAPDSQDESPADSSEPKQSLPDSASAESQTADTVWDELDDLKSRIKKLELTGKMPATSAAAVSGDSSERPRTATTAPTTIESSPKQERKADPETTPAPPPITVGGPNAADIHPLLHSALAKAKPLLSPSLYRILEATASDALQLAVMSGSAGPQGTTFSATSFMHGASVSERHVRRKVDTMCRDLTDLCLALCEGKHEAPGVAASPTTAEPVGSSPTLRYARSSIGPGDGLSRGGARPMSRLEARRTSILGSQRSVSLFESPRESADDVSASELEGTPSQPPAPQRELKRVSRASSRLLNVRPPRYESVSGDEEPTVRPPSRALTDFGSTRVRPTGPREYNSPGQSGSVGARRANAGAYEGNREISRVASLSSDAGRRRWAKESTPPVLEEEGNEGSDYQPPPSHSKRRVSTLGHYTSRRAGGTDLPSRATSLSSRRRLVAEEARRNY